jgi:hypothetical protein
MRSQHVAVCAHLQCIVQWHLGLPGCCMERQVWELLRELEGRAGVVIALHSRPG